MVKTSLCNWNCYITRLKYWKSMSRMTKRETINITLTTSCTHSRFAPCRHWTTTTRIPFVFSLLFKFWISSAVLITVALIWIRKKGLKGRILVVVVKWLTLLDLWRARDLTLFGRVLIIKSLVLSQFVYSASNLNVLQGKVPMLKTKLFKFLWKNKKKDNKREALYQEQD